MQIFLFNPRVFFFYYLTPRISTDWGVPLALFESLKGITNPFSNEFYEGERVLVQNDDGFPPAVAHVTPGKKNIQVGFLNN